MGSVCWKGCGAAMKYKVRGAWWRHAFLEVLTPDQAKPSDIKNSMCRHRSESKQCDALFLGRFATSAGTSGWGRVVWQLTTQKMDNAVVFNASLYESLCFLPGSTSLYWLKFMWITLQRESYSLSQSTSHMPARAPPMSLVEWMCLFCERGWDTRRKLLIHLFSSHLNSRWRADAAKSIICNFKIMAANSVVSLE